MALDASSDSNFVYCEGKTLCHSIYISRNQGWIGWERVVWYLCVGVRVSVSGRRGGDRVRGADHSARAGGVHDA